MRTLRWDIFKTYSEYMACPPQNIAPRVSCGCDKQPVVQVTGICTYTRASQSQRCTISSDTYWQGQTVWGECWASDWGYMLMSLPRGTQVPTGH
ncbi:hypothetical protein XELAEV_18028850mg [Xenopus laevis]|uniref:Uncharacterized protein n=1 Tax=Xenopus laevis TaxID=8355 RepID=A0A974CQI9_XENLA|nr:hypothetical protein XELAEV_18028850mg [Xenopus laevis]